jgi:hypothetical protein
MWIRIRNTADPDPGAWKLVKINKQTWFSAFQKGFCTFVIVCKYIFHVKILLFMTHKSDQDSDQDPHWFGFLDPDPHRDKKSCIRIRNEINEDPQHWNILCKEPSNFIFF